MAQRIDEATETSVLTIAQLAERWQVDRKTLYEMVRTGDLRAIRLGRVLRVPLSEVRSHEQGRVTSGGSNARTS